MDCPACKAVNEARAVQCASCNAPLKKRPVRKRSEDVDAPFGAKPEGTNLYALRAYRLSLLGLIPLVGLVLGPVALVLGIVAAFKGRGDPAYTARIPATGAVVFGTIESVTNWGGVTLIWFGIQSMLS